MTAGRALVHLVNPLVNVGGSEWRTISLHRELQPHADVRVWTEQAAHSDLAGLCPIQRIGSRGAEHPVGGVLVLVGVYWTPAVWLAEARPRRVVVIYNMERREQLMQLLAHLANHGLTRVEIVYASQALKDRTGLPGTVQLSPIDIERFVPARRALGDASFTVGRLSRDVPYKHHPGDPALYARLMAAGCRVRLMGATSLAQRGALPPGLEILPTNAEPPERFLQSLDCFYYRTDDSLYETFGRVVHEAMASGLCVVADARHDYAVFIESGSTGFLFDREADAERIILTLRDDPGLRQRVSAAARASVERRYCARARRQIVDFYLR